MKRAFQIISAIIILLGLTCCQDNQPQKPLILSSDVVEIAADGNSQVTFTVKRGIKDVTGQCTIYSQETQAPLEHYTFSTTTPNSYSFYAMCDSESSNIVNIVATDPSQQEMILELLPSADTLIADGIERVTFTTFCNEEDVTTGSELYIVQEDEPFDKRITDYTFSTSVIGSHHFYSIYKGIVSDTVKITALPIPPKIVISADTLTILADGISAATFTVMSDTTDVSNACEIFANDSLINGNIFTTTVAGSYEIYARVNGYNSNTIIIEAVEPQEDNPEEEAHWTISTNFAIFAESYFKRTNIKKL